MEIGFYLKWPIGMQNVPGWNIIGDELYATSLCTYLNNRSDITSARLFGPNHLPERPLDVMIYLNDSEPNKTFAKNNVLYLQNIYGNNSYNVLKSLREHQYDGYMFISQHLTELHNNDGYSGIYLPFGVDTNLFSPRNHNPKFDFEISYVGNDIKGEERTTRYLMPATKYYFGLFGNWAIPQLPIIERLNFLKQKKKVPEYRKVLATISKGKIPQEEVPTLYSSSKINLNFSHQDCVDWDITTLRTFEVLACKGFLISDVVPNAKKDLVGCMVFTDGNEDLTQKISYYLEHNDERKKIAETGYNYVISNCTMESRVITLMGYIQSLHNNL